MIKELIKKIKSGKMSEVMIKKLEPNGRYIFVLPEDIDITDGDLNTIESELELSEHNIRIAFVQANTLSIIELISKKDK